MEKSLFSNFEDLKKQIKNALSVADYLESKGIDTEGAFTCINPEHPDRHPSMGIDPHTGNAHCFSCGVTYDLFAAIAALEGCDFMEAVKIGAALAGIPYEAPQRAAERDYRPIQAKARHQDKPTKEKAIESPYDFTEAIERGHAALFSPEGAAALEYLRSRGFTDDTIQKNRACFARNWNTFTKGNDGAQTGPAKSELYKLILPYLWTNRPCSFILGELLDRSYQGQFLTYIDHKTGKEKKTRQPLGKYNKLDRIKDQLYNERYLWDQNIPALFICEGIYDAWSIEQAGAKVNAHAVALVGANSGSDRLCGILKESQIYPFIYIGLDNDGAGSGGAVALAKRLDALKKAGQIAGFAITPPPYNGEKSDWNDALKADPEHLAEYITALIYAQNPAEVVTMETETAAASIQGFLNIINSNANTPAISTGFPLLDSEKMLDGGLYPGLYILGALSSLGKTTFVMQMADQIAKQGHHVFIYSLEMAKSELMAKSISRLTYEQTVASNLPSACAKTARGITAGARYSGYNAAEHALIRNAIQSYADYADKITIKEGVGDIGAEHIAREVGNYCRAYPNRKPVVIVDYLQILAAPDVRMTDKQATDKNVLELKRLSRDKGVPVVAISSLNRASYSGSISETAFKESGAIEYGSDVLLGMQFSAFDGADASKVNITEEKAKNPREVQVRILKNRQGKVGGGINYKFYPMFNYFVESEAATDKFLDGSKKAYNPKKGR